MTHTDTRAPGSVPETDRGQLRLLLGSVLLFYLGQQTLNPVIGPLARQMHLAEWQVGVTISTAAVMVVLTSRFWGERSHSWGPRPMLITAMTGGALCMAGFCCAATLGARGILVGPGVFAAFVLLRGVGFGTAMAMVPPTVQASVAAATRDEEARVRGMAQIGAVQGTAMIAGSALGGLLSGFGLLAPLAVIPALMGLAALLLAFRLHGGRHDLPSTPGARLHATDHRIWPYLLASLGTYLAMGLTQTTISFLAQDRLRLSGQATGMTAGALLTACGLGMIAAQTMLIPKLSWHPGRLILAGTSTAAAGCALILICGNGLTLTLAMAVHGIGLGLALPGCAAGPTLLVGAEEQGGLAGLAGSVNALTFIIAPTLGTSLYAWHSSTPVLLAGLVMAAVGIFSAFHQRFRPTAASAAS